MTPLPTRMACLVAALLCLATPTAGFAAGIPDVVHRVDSEYKAPVFVSASKAIGKDGRVSRELLPDAYDTVENYLADPWAVEDGCHHIGELIEEYMWNNNRSSIKLAAQKSSNVFTAKVVEKAFGFNHGVPGQLLRIEPSETFHGATPLASYFIFFPVGEFIAGPYKICKTDRRYPEPPAIGDEVLVMEPEHRKRGPSDPFIYLDDSWSLVVFPNGKAPQLSNDYYSPPGKATVEFSSKAELLGFVTAVLNGEE